MQFSQIINKLYIDEARSERIKARLEYQDVIDFIPNSHDFDIRPYIDLSITKRVSYVNVAGDIELRQLIANHEAQRTGNDYTYKNVLVLPGSITGLYMIGLLTCNPGDHIYIKRPRWYNYKGVFHSFTINDTLNGDERLIVVNNPSYCGGTITVDEAEAIRDAAIRNDCFVVADNIFSKYIYDDSVVNIEDYIPVDRLLIVNSPSKAYSMGGLRIGYCVGPQEVIDWLIELQGVISYGASSLSQNVYKIIFKNNIQPDIEKARHKRDITVNAVRSCGLQCDVPAGGNALLVDISILKNSNKFTTLQDWCSQLLSRYHVIVGPGTMLDAPWHIYLCYCIPYPKLHEGLHRLQSFVLEYV